VQNDSAMGQGIELEVCPSNAVDRVGRCAPCPVGIEKVVSGAVEPISVLVVACVNRINRLPSPAPLSSVLITTPTASG
jgi:hypothetical protein